MANETVKKKAEKPAKAAKAVAAAEGPSVKAVRRSIRTSQRKLNLVAETIRGKGVAKAINELTFSKRRIAKAVLETLQSAIANAENNHGLNIDKLVVKEAYTGKDLVMKRMHARGRGRGARVLKPFSNLTVIVATSGEER